MVPVSVSNLNSPKKRGNCRTLSIPLIRGTMKWNVCLEIERVNCIVNALLLFDNSQSSQSIQQESEKSDWWKPVLAFT
jgi:hypothetical protein